MAIDRNNKKKNYSSPYFAIARNNYLFYYLIISFIDDEFKLRLS